MIKVDAPRTKRNFQIVHLGTTHQVENVTPIMAIKMAHRIVRGFLTANRISLDKIETTAQVNAGRTHIVSVFGCIKDNAIRIVHF